MDTSGLPVPDAIPLLTKLEENLVLEDKFQPNLRQLPVITQVRIIFARRWTKERNCSESALTIVIGCNYIFATVKFNYYILFKWKI